MFTTEPCMSHATKLPLAFSPKAAKLYFPGYCCLSQGLASVDDLKNLALRAILGFEKRIF